MTIHNVFSPPRSVRSYCLDERGSAIPQEGSPTGLLCSWDLLDALSAKGDGPCQLVVMGEWVVDGIRYPEAAVDPAWMHHQGYLLGANGVGWHAPSERCEKDRHVHHQPVAVPARLRDSA